MGKTRDLFKKIRDTKGAFHVKMGTIKDRNGMDLTEAEDIKRWQEYTEELYRKDLHDPDNRDGMISHLELHTLEFKVKWALGSITKNKVNGDDRIPVELFQGLKDDAVKVLHSIFQPIRKTQQWPQDWKRSVFIPIPKKGNAKECSNYCTIALISHASKVMLKILQARLKHYVNHELPDVKAGFIKDRGTRKWQSTPVLLPGKSCGRRSLVGYSPWGREESDTTERLPFHVSLSCIGEGNGNPLQCSCLENPRDGGAWWAAIYGVT